jgi:hypothetical protein
MEPMEVVQVLGNLGEFLGAIAVFATLLYLAVQVREGEKTAKFGAVEANRSQRIGIFVSVRDSPYIAPILVKARSGEALNAEEQERLTAHNSAMWGLLYSEWVERELGLLGEFATFDDMSMAQVLSSPYAMTFWRFAAAGIYPARFVEYVNKKAAAHEAESHSEAFEQARLAMFDS